jgi:hypothetical protein
MIFIGSAILFLVGMMLLLISAFRIVFSLLVLCFHLIRLAVSLVLLVVAGPWLLVQKLVRGQREPEGESITINIYLDDADDVAPVVELPRESFRRLRD